MAKKTTEKFVSELIAARGDTLFDYSRVIYRGSHDKIDITCNTCGGDFLQDPMNHLKGVGCPYCAKNRKLNNDLFLEKINAKGITGYDYSKINVETNSSVLDIRCEKHDVWFKQRVADHLAGKGCKLCGIEKFSKSKTKTTEQFIFDAEKVHGSMYSYKETTYISSSKAVKIFCNKHSDYFWQVPESHLGGKGCPHCAKGGYKSTKSGSLYVLEFDSITKVGITNRSASERIKKINKSSGKDFSILFEFRFSDGRVPQYIETRLLRILHNSYEPVQETYDGSTESFLNAKTEDIILHITRLCTEYYTLNKET